MYHHGPLENLTLPFPGNPVADANSAISRYQEFLEQSRITTFDSFAIVSRYLNWDDLLRNRDRQKFQLQAH